MTLDFLLACSTFFIGWIFPPLFMPLGSSMVGILLFNGMNPRILAVSITIVGVLGYIPLWIIEGYLLQKIYNHSYKLKLAKAMPLLYKFISSVFGTKKLTKAPTWIHTYFLKKPSAGMLFVLAIVCAAPTIPDVLAVSLFQKRMSLPLFLLAGLIGKAITLFPLVFLGKGILDIIFG